MNNEILKEAKSGNPQAIQALMQPHLAKKGIGVQVQRKNALLYVNLTGESALAKGEITAFVRQGLMKLDIIPIDSVRLTACQKGYSQPSWVERIVLRQSSEEEPSQIHRNSQSVPTPNSGTAQIQITINGSPIELELPVVLAITGSFLLVLGAFMPIVSLPIVGSISFFSSKFEGFLLMGFAIAAGILAYKRKFDCVYGPGLAAGLLILLRFVHVSSVLSKMKADLDASLTGNPFRGLADAAIVSTGLQWGWVILFLGVAIVLGAAWLTERQLRRQAWISMAASLGFAVCFGIISLATTQVQYQAQAKDADQSEARVYVGGNSVRRDS